jgi:hypothetical protein
MITFLEFLLLFLLFYFSIGFGFAVSQWFKPNKEGRSRGAMYVADTRNLADRRFRLWRWMNRLCDRLFMFLYEILFWPLFIE